MAWGEVPSGETKKAPVSPNPTSSGNVSHRQLLSQLLDSEPPYYSAEVTILFSFNLAPVVSTAPRSQRSACVCGSN